MGRLSYGDLAYTGYQTTFAIRITSPDDRAPFLDWQRVDRDPNYRPPHYGP